MAARRTLKHLRTFSGILATTTLFAVMFHGQDFTPAQIKKQPVCSLARTNENCKLRRSLAGGQPQLTCTSAAFLTASGNGHDFRVLRSRCAAVISQVAARPSGRCGRLGNGRAGPAALRFLPCRSQEVRITEQFHEDRVSQTYGKPLEVLRFKTCT
jgi:hypothetical protein